MERTFWQLFLLFHVPIRVVELLTGCIQAFSYHILMKYLLFNTKIFILFPNWILVSRYKRMRNVNYTHTWIYEISRYLYFYVGLGELIFLAALSIVGERENIRRFFACLIEYLLVFNIQASQAIRPDYLLNSVDSKTIFQKCTSYSSIFSVFAALFTWFRIFSVTLILSTIWILT